ncbi:MAG: hypothetical protein ACI9WC_000259 [Arenicella sp.]|jgi:hypothetical protein
MANKPMKPRNRQAMNPLMRKGGIHIKSKSAERSQQKAKLKKELRVPDLSSFLLPLLRHQT